MTATNSLYIAKPPRDTRVVVAMSGGVDSSVVAGILKGEGYDVIGITLQLYDYGAAVGKKGACCAGQDIHDARNVATRLEIPHYVLDYEARFRDSVIDQFADSYVAGETPVPCITCNQTVKFRDLLGAARDLGADALATGHYIASRPIADGMALYRAADPQRDQSYFLFATTREQLSFLRFPLGDMHKSDVRGMAEDLRLDVAQKFDSQDICFVPTGRYTNIIDKLRPSSRKEGAIVHLDGRELGRHDGIVNFTIGQRRGLGVAVGDPLFVIGLDQATNQVTVGPREALQTHWLTLRDVNWLGDGSHPSGDRVPVYVRIRSTQPLAPGEIFVREDGVWEVCLTDGDSGVSPGQACVFYEDETPRARVLGGGWIARAQNAFERPASVVPRVGSEASASGRLLDNPGHLHSSPQ